MNKKKIFFATPISAFSDKMEYKKYRRVMSELIDTLKNEYDVYSEIELIKNDYDYDTPFDSAIKDLDIISNSDIFIIHHPRKLQTSTLIELGYALAKEKEIIIISNISDLPYLATGILNFSKVHFISGDNFNKKNILDLQRILSQIP